MHCDAVRCGAMRCMRCACRPVEALPAAARQVRREKRAPAARTARRGTFLNRRRSVQARAAGPEAKSGSRADFFRGLEPREMAAGVCAAPHAAPGATKSGAGAALGMASGERADRNQVPCCTQAAGGGRGWRRHRLAASYSRPLGRALWSASTRPRSSKKVANFEDFLRMDGFGAGYFYESFLLLLFNVAIQIQMPRNRRNILIRDAEAFVHSTPAVSAPRAAPSLSAAAD